MKILQVSNNSVPKNASSNNLILVPSLVFSHVFNHRCTLLALCLAAVTCTQPKTFVEKQHKWTLKKSINIEVL